MATHSSILAYPIDREAWWATVRGPKRVGHKLVQARARACAHTHTHTANPQQFLRLSPLASLLECRVIDSISSQLT